MPRTSTRGGPQTREKIAAAASSLFVEHGFDAVTVAQVAREAGVSSVTVFNHFPRKEDLFLDRADEALSLLVDAVTERDREQTVGESLERLATGLAESRHPLSGLDPRSVPFFRTVAGSPALLARTREIASEAQAALRSTLEADPTFTGDAGFAAAYFVAGYGAVLVETAARAVSGSPTETNLAAHRGRLDLLFATLRGGVLGH